MRGSGSVMSMRIFESLRTKMWPFSTRSIFHDVGVFCVFEVGRQAAKVGGGFVHCGEDGFGRRLTALRGRGAVRDRPKEK